jgi:PAS domain S-box-containing protein
MNDKKRSVLIVDDAPEDCLTYRRFLQKDPKRAYSIFEARCGEDALALYREKRPECILLDYYLPDAEGLDMLDALRRQAGARACAIVVLTGESDIDLAVRAMKQGAQDYLDKATATAEELWRAVDNAIEKTRLQRELERQREWSRITLASIGDAVIAIDTARSVTYMNAMAEFLTGWPAGAAHGRPLEEICRLSATANEAPPSSETVGPIADGAVLELTGPVRRAGERIDIPIEGSGAYIRDADGEILGTVFIFRDISERKKAEAEREALLARERKARAEAEAAVRAKDEFLAMVSHELRSPLNAIYGWTHVLKNLPPDASPELTRRAIEGVQRNAQAQLQLIEDLLDTARIINGKLRLNIRPVALGALVESALDSVREAAVAKNIELKTGYRSNVPQVSGDPDRLRQVIWNLLSNAVKFTPEGGCIELRVQAGDSHVDITVADTGEGISPDFLPHIFERFRQADLSSTRQQGGLGLGLAVVRHLVELHGGSIEAASEGKGKGATFRLRLPLRAAGYERSEAVPLLIETAQRAQATMEASQSLAGVRVLLVDDQAETRDLLAAVLRQAGAETSVAASGAEALRRLAPCSEYERPDVLVCDIAMPGEDGYSVLRELRAVEAREQVERLPAIALTAYAGQEDKARALTAGFQLHISKPAQPAALIEAVASLARVSQA